MIIRLRSRLASSAGPCCRSHPPLHCLPQMQRLGGRSDAINARYCFYRDGLERITVDAAGTVGTLRQQISSDLSMPRENVTLSKDQKLVSNCIRYKQHTTKLNIKPGTTTAAFVQDPRAIQRPEQQQAAPQTGWCTAWRYGKRQIKGSASRCATPTDAVTIWLPLLQLQTYVHHCSSGQE